MCLVKNKEHDTFNYGNISLNNCRQEKILGLTTDNHIENIYRKANQKSLHYLGY